MQRRRLFQMTPIEWIQIGFGVTIPLVVAVGVLPYPVTFLCTEAAANVTGQVIGVDGGITI